jgi:hypothetical protein
MCRGTRTGEGGETPEFLDIFHITSFHLRNLGFDFYPLRHGIGSFTFHRFIRQLHQAGGNAGEPKAIIYLDILQCAVWHAGVERFIRVLNDSHTATRLNSQQASSSIVERTREHYSHHSGSVGVGCRTKERIGGWPVTVLPWTAHDADVSAFDQEMRVRRCHVDAPRLNRVTILRMDRLQGSKAAQDRREHTWALSWNVEDNKHGNREVRRWTADQLFKRFHPARGGSDHNDVISRQCFSLSQFGESEGCHLLDQKP